MRTSNLPPVYAWPCDRKEAHGPHPDCPGVRAHPDTMIGRDTLPIRARSLIWRRTAPDPKPHLRTRHGNTG